MPVLVVVAHPDDEVLGCGGTVAYMASRGIPVRACILSSQVEVRRNRPEDKALLEDIYNAHELLGIGEPILGEFPNIKMNSVPHHDLVQFIEKVILDVGAEIIFTHHPADLNSDHQVTSLACQAAARLFQRRSGLPRLRSLFYTEVLSSSDWAFPGSQRTFEPTTFVEIGEDFLRRKIEALRQYRGVMRQFPHPRCEEILRGLAAYRGGQAGLCYAEAFQTAFNVLRIGEESE